MPPQVRRSTLSLPRPLVLFLAASFLLTSSCLLIELFCKLVLRWQYPYTWPLTPVYEIVFDLNSYVRKFDYLHSKTFFATEPQYPFAYPAPVALFYRLIYWDHWHRGRVFACLILLSFGVAAYFAGKAAIQRGLDRRTTQLLCCLTLMMSYPLAFEIKQGNVEIFVWILLSAGVFLFLRQREYSAAACFAIAGSMKIFPFIYLGLHIARGRWKPVFVAFGVAALLTLFSLWLIAPDIAYSWQHITGGMTIFQQEIVLQVKLREIGFDHSLFSVVKRIWNFTDMTTTLASVLHVYMTVVALSGIVLYFARIRFLPFVNQVLCLVICSIILPPVSYDYTLIHLYIPFTLLALLTVEAARAGVRIRGLQAALILLAITFSPLAEFVIHRSSISGQIKASFLFGLLIVGLTRRFPSSFDRVASRQESTA